MLLVSGGHTLVIEVTAPGRYRLLGGTIDDAAGEAFDKVARFLGLGYPGGPAIDRVAADGDPTAFAFPRSLPGDGFDFSFSGLKTAVVTTVRRHPEAGDRRRGRLVSPGRGRRAGHPGHDGGSGHRRPIGVAGRRGGGQRPAAPTLEHECEAAGLQAFLPSRALCTDNAAMVAAAGTWGLTHRGPSPLTSGPIPTWPWSPDRP